MTSLYGISLGLLSMIVLSCITGMTTKAGYLQNEYYIHQGSTLELQVPQYEIATLEGLYDGKKVRFYQIEEEPAFDQDISRAEFIELMVLNHNELSQRKLEGAKTPQFLDVSMSTSFKESIEIAAEQGIISGYSDGNFGPHDPITRGQIAKILSNAFSPTGDNKKAKAFADVPEDHQFYQAIQRSIAAGYFQGYPDGLMRPDRTINFSEAETVIRRASNKTFIQTLGKRPFWRAFIGIHRLSELTTKYVTLNYHYQNNDTNSENIAIHILERDFPTVSFTLAPQKEELLGREEQDTTWIMINNAKAQPQQEVLWEGAFIMPTLGEATLGFGDKLYINGKYSGSHFGHDWANSEGTEVYASNSGVVTLAGWTTSYGNTIIIDHGQNVFTMYLHLSELQVEEGTKVSKKELIGNMGSTGVATGSHLHFTHFIGDIIVDSEEWFSGQW